MLTWNLIGILSSFRKGAYVQCTRKVTLAELTMFGIIAL